MDNSDNPAAGLHGRDLICDGSASIAPCYRFRFPRARLTGLVAMLCFSPLWAGQAAANNTLTVLQSPALIVDPTCGTCDGAQAILTLRNGAAASIKLQLATGDLVNKTTGQPLNANFKLTPLSDVAGTKPLEDATASSNAVFFVRAEVRNVLQVGEWNADLLNDGAKIGTLKVVRSAIPFSITLDVPQPDNPALTFAKGSRGIIAFKNADTMGHTIAWGLMINGKMVTAGSDAAFGGANSAPAVLTVPAQGSALALFDVPGAWFSGDFILGLVKDETEDGQLSVQLMPANCTAASCQASPDSPSKIFKVKVDLTRISNGWQSLWRYGIGFLFLFIGGMLSLLTNLVVPNLRQRIGAASQLGEIEHRIAGLSMKLASRLRVLAGQELHNLKEQLSSAGVWHPEAHDTLETIATAATRLGQRVDILEKMGSTRDHFEPFRTNDWPPSLIDAIDNRFELTVQLLDGPETNDVDLQSAKANLTDIEKCIGNLESKAKDTDFEEQFQKRRKSLLKDLGKDGTLQSSLSLKPMQEKLPGLFEHLESMAADNFALDTVDYARWDTILCKLDLIRKYVTWREAGQRDNLQEIEDQLVKRLLTFSLEGLESARTLVREIHQGILPKDVADLMVGKKLKIRKDRYEVRQFALTQFYVEFEDQRFNEAVARDEFDCIWDFGHLPGSPPGWRQALFIKLRNWIVPPAQPAEPVAKENMKEYGWNVSHYFPRPDRYDLKAHFQFRQSHRWKNQAENLPPVRRSIVVAAQKTAGAQRTYLREAFILFVALLPPLAGLIAGAEAEFMKLDLVPALAAIVGLGFFSDQIKNVLISPKK